MCPWKKDFLDQYPLEEHPLGQMFQHQNIYLKIRVERIVILEDFVMQYNINKCGSIILEKCFY